MPALYDPTLPLISIHVPKTGGSTFREMLKKWFGEDFRQHYVEEAAVVSPQKHEYTEPVCIHGHFNRFRNFGVDNYYPQSKQFITFLRDPFEQHVSLFFYLRHLSHDYKFQGRVPEGTALRNFEEFTTYLIDLGDQIQTTFANTFLAHLPARFENFDTNSIFENNFIHMGVTEKFEASTRLLATKLNKKYEYAPSQNISPRNLQVRPSSRDVHLKFFEKEHIFYNQIKQKHYMELAEAGLLE